VIIQQSQLFVLNQGGQPSGSGTDLSFTNGQTQFAQAERVTKIRSAGPVL